MNEAPQSAAGHLEPYGVRIALQPTTQALDPRPFLIGLLEQLATSCLASGASVIGHLKCLLRTPEGVLGCNLTSVRSGASCTAGPGAYDGPRLRRICSGKHRKAWLLDT